jgi:hypothetical protein
LRISAEVDLEKCRNIGSKACPAQAIRHDEVESDREREGERERERWGKGKL